MTKYLHRLLFPNRYVTVALVARVKCFLKTNRYTAPLMNDMELRGRVSPYFRRKV